MDDEINGDQSGIEQEWDHDHSDEEFTPGQVMVRKGIGERNRKQHIDGDAAQHDDGAVGSGPQKRRMAKSCLYASNDHIRGSSHSPKNFGFE